MSKEKEATENIVVPEEPKNENLPEENKEPTSNTETGGDLYQGIDSKLEEKFGHNDMFQTIKKHIKPLPQKSKFLFTTYSCFFRSNVRY